MKSKNIATLSDNGIWLPINLDAPPAGVDLGIQEGKESVFDTVLKQRSTGASLQFEFQIPVNRNRAMCATSFYGPPVQGPAATHVISRYRKLAGQTNFPFERREKVSL